MGWRLALYHGVLDEREKMHTLYLFCISLDDDDLEMSGWLLNITERLLRFGTLIPRSTGLVPAPAVCAETRMG